MKEELSAGGVVYKFEDDKISPKILLCYQKKLSGNKAYCLPKGHIEAGESTEEAALREVFEETGIKAEIEVPLSEINYIFTEKGEKVKKTVVFFLMRMLSQSFQPNDETEDVAWCSEKEALELDKYTTEQDVIKMAFKLLKRRSERAD